MSGNHKRKHKALQVELMFNAICELRHLLRQFDIKSATIFPLMKYCTRQYELKRTRAYRTQTRNK